ncbi:hypothetical protein EZS27_010692 [termite gut metagenome]|uniref:Uncharacterized protein n=1 Tax=termite gut metagenome TaxID=433724 RepID=A0A5J4S705_9ZZZZ
MGKRDEQYHLLGVLELDEGFFSTETQEEEKTKTHKRGRGSQNQTPKFFIFNFSNHCDRLSCQTML